MSNGFLLQLEKSPDLPPNFCYSCNKSLDFIPLFHRKILASHERLYKHFHSLPPVQEPNIEMQVIAVEMSKIDTDPQLLARVPTIKTDLSESDVVGSGEKIEITDIDPAMRTNGEDLLAIREPSLRPKRKGLVDVTAPAKVEPVVRSVVRRAHNPTKDELRLEKLMVERELFTCKVCDLNTNTLYGLRDHVRDKHDLKTYRICCDKTITAYMALDLYDHIRVHLDKDAFKCIECGKHFQRSRFLELHRRNNHSQNPPTHICEHCGKGFWTKVMLDGHARVRHEGKATCKYCGNGTVIAFLNCMTIV